MRDEQEDTRKSIIEEMLEKEGTYLSALDLLIEKYHKPLLDRASRPCEAFKKSEVEKIFKGLADIRRYHQQVQADLQRVLKEWTPKTSCVGQLWFAKAAHEFAKHYPKHIRRQEDVLLTLDECETRPDFLDFIESVESDPACGRHRLRDLLIRPVQHLPHVQIQLQRLLKETPEQHPDYQEVRAACIMIARVNKRANIYKEKMDGQFELIAFLNRIDQLPGEYYHAGNRLVDSVDMKVLEATGGVLREKCMGKWVRLVLLNCKPTFQDWGRELDGRVLFLKARSSAEKTEIKRSQSVAPYGGGWGQVHTYPQPSVSKESSAKGQPWRFLAQHKFSDFLHFGVVRSKEIFTLKVGDDDAYNLCIFRLHESTPFEKALTFFNKLVEQEHSLETEGLWNDLQLEELTEEDFSWTVKPDRRSDFEVIAKAMKKLNNDNRVSRRSLFRTFSNLTSWGVSYGLRRFTTFGSAINLMRPALMSAEDYEERDEEDDAIDGADETEERSPN